MALSFPLALADLMDRLPIGSITIDLPDSLAKSGETGGGDILTADIGHRLWKGDILIADINHADAEDAASRISVLRAAGRSFFVYDKARPGPRQDPDGSILGAATVRIQSIASNNRDVVLYGVPVGYVLSTGDKLSFAYGSNPIRHAYHRMVTGGAANGAGQVAIEVDPPIQAGAVPDIVVTLVKPVCKAVYVPGSFTPGSSQGTRTTGIKFSWQQTLR